MIGWLRRVFASRPKDAELERLARDHRDRVASVPETVRDAHAVSARIIADAFKSTDDAVFNDRLERPARAHRDRVRS
jgi:hypothetical protein